MEAPQNIELLSSKAGVMPRRYRAKESILVICLHSSDSDPESWDAIGFGMLWASPNPNLAYEDEEMGALLS